MSGKIIKVVTNIGNKYIIRRNPYEVYKKVYKSNQLKKKFTSDAQLHKPIVRCLNKTTATATSTYHCTAHSRTNCY